VTENRNACTEAGENSQQLNLALHLDEASLVLVIGRLSRPGGQVQGGVNDRAGSFSGVGWQLLSQCFLYCVRGVGQYLRPRYTRRGPRLRAAILCSTLPVFCHPN
jgi:hypothetical protein